MGLASEDGVERCRVWGRGRRWRRGLEEGVCGGCGVGARVVRKGVWVGRKKRTGGGRVLCAKSRGGW